MNTTLNNKNKNLTFKEQKIRLWRDLAGNYSFDAKDINIVLPCEGIADRLDLIDAKLRLCGCPIQTHQHTDELPYALAGMLITPFGLYLLTCEDDRPIAKELGNWLIEVQSWRKYDDG